MKGVYVCYNEEKSGSYREPFGLSNKTYLIWKSGSPYDPDKNGVRFPSKIIIKISGTEEYFIGDLLLIKPYEHFSIEVFQDPVHRPQRWNTDEVGARTVIFMANLKSFQPWADIRERHPPQGITTVEIPDEL